MAHILIVDDDDDNRQTIRWVLENDGYVVEEVAGGASALEALRTRPDPCVVVLDLLMFPPPDGQAVLEAVLAEQTAPEQRPRRPDHQGTARQPGPLGRHAYVVVSAAEHYFPQIRALLARLPAPLLRKPFRVDKLTATVAEAAGRLGGGEG